MTEAIKILIIEDQEDHRILLDEHLNRHMFAPIKLTFCDTLQAARNQCNASPPDIILLDLYLPDSSGIPTFTSMYKEFEHIPIVVMSSLGSQETALEAVRCGAQDYISKVELAGKNLPAVIRHAIERHQLNKQLKIANRSKGQFLANMSHEIRTPLNAIIGNASIMTQGSLEPWELMICADRINKAGNHLLSLIDDILDIEKIEAGKVQLETIGFNLLQLLEETMDIFAESAHSKGIEFGHYYDADCLETFQGDPGRIRQILANLISNSIKFTSDGEIIVSAKRVASDEDSTTLKFHVRDTGKGIPEDRIGLIFKTFTQEDESMTRNYGGTGLGLSICKSLIQMMGGEIGVESEPGVGSVFWFTITLPHAPNSSKRQYHHFNNEKILVIDDSESCCKYLSFQLKRWGLHCDYAVIPEQGLARLKQQKYDAIIIDENMPDMSGVELSTNIHNDVRWQRLPIVLATNLGFKGRHSYDYYRRAGIYQVLTKPFKFQALSTVLVNALSGQAPPWEGTPAEQKRNSAPSQPKGQVLVVDDSHSNLIMTKKIIECLGHEAVTVSDAAQAIEKVKARKFDLVFMDCQMPDMDGYEATRIIRSLPRYSDVPIVALTANTTQNAATECFEAGMDDYLSKPIVMDDVSEKLAMWMENKQENKEDESCAPGSPQTATKTDEVLDSKIINSIVDLASDDHLFLEEQFKLFSERVVDLEVKIKSAYGRSDYHEVAILAHALRGTAGSIGAARLSKLCATIETYVGKKDVRPQIMELEREIATAEDALIWRLGLNGYQKTG